MSVLVHSGAWGTFATSNQIRQNRKRSLDATLLLETRISIVSETESLAQPAY